MYTFLDNFVNHNISPQLAGIIDKVVFQDTIKFADCIETYIHVVVQT